MKHAKITTIQTRGDIAKITIQNYNEELMSTVVRTEQRIITNDHNLFADWIKALRELAEHTTDCLDVTIKRTNSGDIRMVKTWTEKS